MQDSGMHLDHPPLAPPIKGGESHFSPDPVTRNAQPGHYFFQSEIRNPQSKDPEPINYINPEF